MKRSDLTLSHQAVLLIAFGGPASPEEIRPFLDRVLKGIPIPQERLEEVVRHYEAVGGRSPMKEITLRQAQALQELLEQKGLPVPVYIGMRNASPFFAESLKRMAEDGIQRALGFILSPQQTEASWERYQKNVAAAQAELGGAAPVVDYCPGWHAHPLFIRTLAEQIRSNLNGITMERRRTTPLIFTAHSLPTAMASRSPYVTQVKTTAQLVAQELGHLRWSVAYQSRSGRPREPWLEPDIGQAIRNLAAEGVSEILVAPIGFVCDHVEVLYDLDIEAKKIAHDLGMRFIRMIADIVEASLGTKAVAAQ
jgi:ferrochelatase